MLPRGKKLALLSALYLAEGVPYGFQALALPVLLREQGTSLKAIGWATALSLPWMLKALWAPLVERWSWERLGPRKSWIVPMLLLLILTCLGGLTVLLELGSTAGLAGLLALVFVQNLASATLDVAVDGLAVDLLDPHELGMGNTAQVVGYKAGMFASGGILLGLSERIGGWPGMFLCMSLLLGLALWLSVRLLSPEPPPSPAAAQARGSLRDVLRTVGGAVAGPGGWSLLLFLATYKLGEALLSVMFKPFLQDQGVTPAQIGVWVGGWGLLFSTLGSVLGGVLAHRLGLWPAMAWAALLRSLSMLGPALLALGLFARWPLPHVAVPVLCLEELCGGALTTATFAFMMSRTDRRVGAAHYTLLASVEVWGKGLVAFFSGQITQALGYGPAFALAAGVSLGLLPVLLLVRGVPLPPAPERA